jgi:hypothetical protein
MVAPSGLEEGDSNQVQDKGKAEGNTAYMQDLGQEDAEHSSFGLDLAGFVEAVEGVAHEEEVVVEEAVEADRSARGNYFQVPSDRCICRRLWAACHQRDVAGAERAVGKGCR